MSPGHNNSTAPMENTQNKDHDPRTRWTCIACRRRKVKCDRTHPCTNCRKASIECITPPSGRSSAKTRKRHDSHHKLLKRVASLEGILKSSKQSNSSHTSTSASSCEGDEPALFQSRQEKFSLEGTEQTDGEPSGCFTPTAPSSLIPENDDPEAGVICDLSRLFTNPGGSRFVNTCMLDILEQEVQNLNGMLESNGLHHSEDDDLDFASEGSVTGYPPQIHTMSSVNGYSSILPHPQYLQHIWSLFKIRVDPVVKVLHIPSLEPVITIAVNSSQLSEELVALVLAISYAAIASLSDVECLTDFGRTRATLSSHYRSACEQACTRAGFLQSTKVAILQAYVIYLVALRRSESPNVVWSLAGLAMRVAQTMGLRSDGTHWNLSPFDTEMRRRLWWELCALEAQVSEEHGCAPAIAEAQFDTCMPLNVDDADLHPDMTQLPVSKTGTTEMTICLIKFKFTDTLRQVLRQRHNIATQLASPEGSAAQTLEQKEVWINERHQEIEHTYLSGLDLTLPSTWVVATFMRLHLSTTWLMVFPHTQNLEEGMAPPDRLSEKLFIASIESIEYGNLLDNDSRASQWHWFFGMNRQWHSVVFTLSVLCKKSKGQLVDRAWEAVEVMVRTRFGSQNKKAQHLLLWQLLKKMLIKARMAREKTFVDKLLSRSAELDGDVSASIACYPAIDQLLKSESRAKVMSAEAGPSHPTAAREYLERRTTYNDVAEIPLSQQMWSAVEHYNIWDSTAFETGLSMSHVNGFVGRPAGDDSESDQALH